MSAAGTMFSPDDLLAYADGRLDESRTGDVERWLADHPEEQRQVEEWRQQTGLLKAALDPVLHEPVPDRLSAIARRRASRLVSPVLRGAIAAAIVAFPAGLLAGHYLSLAPRDGTYQQLADAGLAAHRIYAVEVRHPVEVGADQEAHLVAWLGKRLDAPLKAPDLSGAGLHLLGGRLVDARDQPGALLMYEGDGGERYTLLVQRFAPERMTAFRYETRGEIGAFYWVDGDLGYVLTGPADRPRLLGVAEAVYKQLD